MTGLTNAGFFDKSSSYPYTSEEDLMTDTNRTAQLDQLQLALADRKLAHERALATIDALDGIESMSIREVLAVASIDNPPILHPVCTTREEIVLLQVPGTAVGFLLYTEPKLSGRHKLRIQMSEGIWSRNFTLVCGCCEAHMLPSDYKEDIPIVDISASKQRKRKSEFGAFVDDACRQADVTTVFIRDQEAWTRNYGSAGFASFVEGAARTIAATLRLSPFGFDDGGGWGNDWLHCKSGS